MPGDAGLLAAGHARDEAIRQARRMGDPGAVCAALAVMEAWEADEARGRDLAARFVETGLLDGAQLRGLLGAGLATPFGAALESGVTAVQPEPAVSAEAALQPEPAAVAVLEAPEPAPATPPPTPVEAEPTVVAAPTTAEIGAAEAPPVAAEAPAAAPEAPAAVPEAPAAAIESAPTRPSRRPLVAAALLGVGVALVVWLRLGGGAQAPVPPPPTVPRFAPFPSAPLPPPLAPARPPLWAPRLREVREGDSPALHDRLGRLAKQIRVDDEPAGVSYDAQQLVARRPKQDRIVRWVELRLVRFYAVAGLQSRLEDGARAVDVAWARE